MNDVEDCSHKILVMLMLAGSFQDLSRTPWLRFPFMILTSNLPLSVIYHSHSEPHCRRDTNIRQVLHVGDKNDLGFLTLKYLESKRTLDLILGITSFFLITILTIENSS
jgi:hypothetical protein